MILPFVIGAVGSLGSLLTSCSTTIAGIGAAVATLGPKLATVSKTLLSIQTSLAGITSALKEIGPIVSETFFGRKINTQATSLFSRFIAPLSGPLGIIFGPMITQLMVFAVSKVVNKVAEKFGIIEKGEKQEHVGYRLEEAGKHANDWQQRETFESFKNYYKYLKEKIPEVDETKIKGNEAAYQWLGTMAVYEGIQEELGIKLPEDFLMEVGRSKMEPEEYLAFADVSGKYGWEAVQGYLKNTLPVKELDKIGGALLSALEQHCLGKSSEDLKIRLSHICAASNNDKVLAAKIYHEDLLKEYPEAIKEAEENKALPEWWQNKGV